MGTVLSSHRPQTGTAPLIEVGYLCLSVHELQGSQALGALSEPQHMHSLGTR